MVRAHLLKLAIGVVLNSVVLTALLAASSANAQTAPVNTTSTQAVLKQLTAGASGATVNAVSTGAVVTSNGTVLVPASGLKVPVPVSVAANVSKARIAAGALGCTTGIGAAVCVATAAAVAHELLNRPAGVGRYRKCPDGTYAFLCKEIPETYQPVEYIWYRISGGVQGYYGRTLDAMCAMYPYVKYENNVQVTYQRVGHLNNAGCVATNGEGYFSAGRMYQCPYPLTFNPGAPAAQACGSAAQTVPATETEIAQSLQEKMDEEFEANRRLVEALRQDQATAEATGRQQPEQQRPVVSSTPVTVNAPPVTSPEETVKVESKPGPNGSTDTTTTKQQSTVTPQVSGSTVGDTVIKYPSTTTITQTTINNITNETTTNQTVVNNPTPQSDATQFPDDYAREDTLQQVRDSLKTEGAPDMPDQKEIVDTEVDQSKNDITDLVNTAKTEQATDKNLWFSWVWTPPMGQCAPFAGSVSGFQVSWDMCPTIANINEVIGWMFSIFAALSVYGNLFRKE